MLTAAAEAAGSDEPVRLVSLPALSDQEALRIEQRSGERATVQVAFRDAEHRRARLRLHAARTDRWIDREIEFQEGDSASERGRALGFAIAWPMDSTQAFHAIINLFLIPLWLLSGALFPLTGASGWLRVLMRLNPLTYGVEALRTLLYPGTEAFALGASMATLILFSAFMFGLAFIMVNRRTTKPAA